MKERKQQYSNNNKFKIKLANFTRVAKTSKSRSKKVVLENEKHRQESQIICLKSYLEKCFIKYAV